MKRREFIKASVLSTGAVALTNCKSPTATDPAVAPAYDGTVAIIGAGAAGLYAGFLLQQQNVNYTIFEASDVVGGRIKTLKGFADFDIELGAEEIYGKKSAWYDIVKAANPTFLDPTKQIDYYQIGNQLRSEDLWKTDVDFTAAQNMVTQAENYVGAADITLQQLMDNNRLPARVQHIVNAKVANEAGTSATRLSVKGLSEEILLQSSGSEILEIAGKSLLSILQDKCKDVLPKVRLNSPIVKIDYSQQKITLEDTQGNKLPFDKVIITVPLPILQNNLLKFTPDLPAAKTIAFTKIGMGAGVKVVLQFTKAFWAANTGSIYGTGTVPEYIVTSEGRSTQTFVLTAVAMGSRAETIISRGANAVSSLVTELDNIYGRGVASGVLKNGSVMDWSKEPYIRGAYSFPIVGGGGAFRQDLSQSVLRKLYFAGEATHYGGHSGTVHGAIETAQRAVTELIKETK